mmetsp:Transcript_56553/g.47702  ORF Transcript_56553/g.47702 Transcript_56553/m.47702 type:complete len:173 (+) Transcript_56553:204-722(+)
MNKYNEIIDKFVILFVGVIFESELSKNIKNIAENLKDKYKGLRLDIYPFTFEMNKFYLMSDVLLQPSKGETFGLTSAEAMAGFNMPIIAMQTPNSANYIHIKDIEDNKYGKYETGWLFEDNNAEMFANYMHDMIIMDENDRLKLGINGGKYSRSKFNIVNVADRYLELFNKL